MKKAVKIILIVVSLLFLMGLTYNVGYRLGYNNAQSKITEVKPKKLTLKQKALGITEDLDEKYYTGKPDPQEMLELVNKERAKVGVEPLKIDSTMSATATWKANDMYIRNYFDHDMPGTKYMLPEKYRKIVWDKCNISGENITDNAAGEDNHSQQAFHNFKTSKPHYKAMISPDHKLIGFGVAGTKVVFHFCQPK